MRLGVACLVLLACASGKRAAPAPAPAAEDSPCQGDGDCALTHVEAGACCPMLCAPRVVTTHRAEELKAKSASCGRPCPLPQCMPPRQHIVPSCVQNRCVAKPVPMEN